MRAGAPQIRLPAAVVEALGLREGDDVTLRAVGTHVLEVEKTPATPGR
jgi:antitoxin MazE